MAAVVRHQLCITKGALLTRRPNAPAPSALHCQGTRLVRMRKAMCHAQSSSMPGAASSPASSSVQPSSSSSPTAAAAAAAAAAGTPGLDIVVPASSACLSSEEVQERMKRKLAAALQPSSMHILDESPAPKQSRQAAQLGLPLSGPHELHFRLEIVSPEFEGMSRVKRQRLVYQVVAEEFSLGLHALSLVTKAPSEL